MRALRDFNIPKIVTDDLPVFMGLIGDLFPALDVPRKRDPEFEKIIKGAVLHLRLQPEDSFVLKVSRERSSASLLAPALVYASALPARGRECVYVLQMFFMFFSYVFLFFFLFFCFFPVFFHPPKI